MERSRVAFLHRCAGLGRLRPEDLTRLSGRVSQVRFARRATLWREGEAAATLYWIRSGVVREQLEGQGRTVVLGLYGRGELCGEGGVLEALAQLGATRHTLAEAHEETTVFALSALHLAELVEQIPLLAIDLAAAAAARRRRIEQRLGVLLLRSAAARVATLLLELGEAFGVRDSRGVIVNVRLTHRDVAALVGTSRETASFVLLDLRARHLVETEGKRVVLLDPEGLAAFARDA